jgi:hypothetical protein
VNFYVLHPKARRRDWATASKPSNEDATAHHVLGCVQLPSPIDEERPGDFTVEDGSLGTEFPSPEMLPGKLRP